MPPVIALTEPPPVAALTACFSRKPAAVSYAIEAAASTAVSVGSVAYSLTRPCSCEPYVPVACDLAEATADPGENSARAELKALLMSDLVLAFPNFDAGNW